MCCSGMGSPTISKVLNAEGVLTPRNYWKSLCKKPMQLNKLWSPESIIVILRNRVYKGDMVQGTYSCSRFKRTPNKLKPQEEWIITPDTHEPLVDEVTWDYAQTCLNSRKRVMKNNKTQLFAGYIKCADCGYALAYARRFGTEYYSCGHYRRRGAEYCTQHYINKNVLTEAVLDDIRRIARLAQEDETGFAEQLAQLSMGKVEKQAQSTLAEQKVAKARCEELDSILKRVYEDSVLGRITDNRFQKLSAEYEAEQAALEKQLEDMQTVLIKSKKSKQDSAAWLELIKQYADIKELVRIILSELIEKVTVYDYKHEFYSKEKNEIFITGEFGPWSTDDKWVDTSGPKGKVSLGAGAYLGVGLSFSAEFDVQSFAMKLMEIWN